MNRKVLLIEPNYKNKYPPMGLMKIATYYRRCKDDVRFYKGDLKLFAAQLLCEEFYKEVGENCLARYFSKLVDFIKVGRYSILDPIPDFHGSANEELLKVYRQKYKNGNFPQFDVVGVTTLFTFYWKQTIDTINYAKKFCTPNGKMLVGGIAATILPEFVYTETGIRPHIGLLDQPGTLDEGNTDIIDELPLDYSILEEVDYKYPAKNAYFGYMTRGCPRNCEFCAVKVLEPEYKNYIGIQNQIKYIDEHFGQQKDLYLMDNNVFASRCFNKIIDEIKACGFAKGASFLPPNEYEVAVKNLQANYNPRAYVKKIIGIYDQIAKKLPEDEAGDFYLRREAEGLLYVPSATVERIIAFDNIARPLYSKYFQKKRTARYIDFNQGLDARLVTSPKMEKLSEINIRPLRIAFDHYDQRDIYIEAVRKATEYHITDLSNYLLYNFEDKPEELYYRMRINVDLCEELGVTIYSFPMKYHPISDPEYFRNRDYIGKHWNRKFIRSVQAVLNSTKGKIGRGVNFFEEAFGRDIEEFKKILWMPETFIIYRRIYDANLRERLADRYTERTAHDCDLANEWWAKFSGLPPEKAAKAKEIIALNKFKDSDFVCNDPDILDVLSYYRITRDDAER